MNPETRGRVEVRLDALLGASDLSVMTPKALRLQLEEEFSVDLSSDEEKAWIKAKVNRHVQEREEEEDDDDDEDEDEDEEEAEEPSPSKKRRAGRATPATTTTPKSKPSRKKTPPDDVSDDDSEGDESHPLLSAEMAAVVGKRRANHFRLTKLLWKYIKAHDLQNPSKRTEILCDDALKSVFDGADVVTSFGMSKLLGAHIYKDGAPRTPAASSTTSATKPSAKTAREEATTTTTTTTTTTGKKRKQRASGGEDDDGVVADADYKGSAELAAFVGAKINSRFKLTKRMWQYIKAHDLQDPTNRRVIRCDDALRDLFGVDTFTQFELAKHLGKHFD